MQRSPGNSSPRLSAGDESGFFIITIRTELELLQSAFSAQRMSKYLRYHHDDSASAIQHYWINKDMPAWLATIDHFDSTLDSVRKELR